MTALSAIDQQKKRAAEYAVSKVESGMKVGLGTGSTARFAVAALGERVRKEGLKLKCIPTSEATRDKRGATDSKIPREGIGSLQKPPLDAHGDHFNARALTRAPRFPPCPLPATPFGRRERP